MLVVSYGISGRIFGLISFFLSITLLLDVICNITIYAEDTTPCPKYDQASDLWQ